MILYRGDKITNTTEPGRYRFDGIRSKSFGQGTPAYIGAKSLLENIRKHVNPVSASDWNIYDKTEFLSFSTSFDRAYFWLSSQGSEKLAISKEEYFETRYLFTLDIAQDRLEPLDEAKTMFIYRFACNTELKRSNSTSIKEHLIFRSVETNSYFKYCPICEGTYSNHAILLIDTVKYLGIYKDSPLFDGAINNAAMDSEWLVLPTDALSGFSETTIPRADYWSASHYNCEGEMRPPAIHEILGMEYDTDGHVV